MAKHGQEHAAFCVSILNQQFRVTESSDRGRTTRIVYAEQIAL